MTAERPRRNNATPAPGRLEPGPQSRTLVNHILETLPALEDELEVVVGFERFGSPFAAYLILPDTIPADLELITKFEVTYADSWKTIDELIADELEGLGWAKALDEFRNEHNISADVLHWNRQAVLASIREIYTIITLDGWNHAFLK